LIAAAERKVSATSEGKLDRCFVEEKSDGGGTSARGR
jgi:hypothetical protein